MMKAILMNAPGPAEHLELRDIVEPQIVKDTQLKIALKAAGINPIDTKFRKRGLFHPQALPAVLGCDGAGIVAETGTVKLLHLHDNSRIII